MSVRAAAARNAQTTHARRWRKKSALIQYGSADLYNQILGNDPAAQAAGQNPFGVVQELDGCTSRTCSDQRVE